MWYDDVITNKISSLTWQKNIHSSKIKAANWPKTNPEGTELWCKKLGFFLMPCWNEWQPLAEDACVQTCGLFCRKWSSRDFLWTNQQDLVILTCVSPAYSHVTCWHRSPIVCCNILTSCDLQSQDHNMVKRFFRHAIDCLFWLSNRKWYLLETVVQMPPDPLIWHKGHKIIGFFIWCVCFYLLSSSALEHEIFVFSLNKLHQRAPLSCRHRACKANWWIKRFRTKQFKKRENW